MPPRLFPGDEELGKKDDDHKPGSRTPLTPLWPHHRTAARRSLKRLALGVLAIVALYYFFKNMPTDVQQRSRRPLYIHPEAGEQTAPHAKPPPSSQGPTTTAGTKAEAISKGEDNELRHDFNGPIKFYKLAETLQPLSSKSEKDQGKGHVLYAASSLKSTTILVPMACEMARWKRNRVHFAVMGRDDISMDLVKAVNGITEECDVTFHGTISHSQSVAFVFSYYSQMRDRITVLKVPISEWKSAHLQH
jgi:hypothetical protein